MKRTVRLNSPNLNKKPICFKGFQYVMIESGILKE